MGAIDDVVSMAEASRLLGRDPVALRNWIRAGRLSGRLIDGRVYIFDRAEVERAATTMPRRKPGFGKKLTA